MTPLTIGIDLRPLGTASGRRGVGTYLRGLVPALIRERADETLILFHDAAIQPDLPGGTDHEGVLVSPLTRPRRAATIWDQIAWPRTLERGRVGIFHSPFWALPILASRSVALVQTIHDLTPLKIAGSVSLRNKLLFRANFACARRAARIIVPSGATARDVEEILGISPSRIRPIPEAATVEKEFLDRAGVLLPRLRERLGLPGRYLLHTGGHDAVKDLGTAIEATALLAGKGYDLRLVVTGEAGPATAGIRGRAAAAGIEGRLVITGFTPHEELIALYCGAAALVYPSLNEGFGLPVLEAMACGTPVVAAAAGALPEVGGDACLYAAPGDPASFAEALDGILRDDALARRLSEAGRRRACTFTWREAARRTLDVYREVAA